MSAFDKDVLLNAAVQGENDTKYPRVGVGEYMALIEDIDYRCMEGKGKDGADLHFLDLTYDLSLDEAKKPADWPDGLKFQIKDSIFLDITPDGKISTAPGTNINLGRIREAVGQNRGSDWSAAELRGAGPLIIRVEEEPNEKDISDPYKKVKRWAKPNA